MVEGLSKKTLELLEMERKFNQTSDQKEDPLDDIINSAHDTSRLSEVNEAKSDMEESKDEC